MADCGFTCQTRLVCGQCMCVQYGDYLQKEDCQKAQLRATCQLFSTNIKWCDMLSLTVVLCCGNDDANVTKTREMETTPVDVRCTVCGSHIFLPLLSIKEIILTLSTCNGTGATTISVKATSVNTHP